MVEFYCIRIRDKKQTIDTVPARFVEDVLKRLKEHYKIDGYGNPI